jgi:beta-lysine 5,6-aminomutase alpha subunit
MQEYVDRHSTVSVERTVCRLLGIDGVDKFDVPLPNIVVEALEENDKLVDGAAYFFGNAMLQTGMYPNRIAQCIASGEINVRKIVKQSSSRRVIVDSHANDQLRKIRKNKEKRNELLKVYGDKKGPLLYVIVATGNIYEDITQAVAAANQGVDVIAVIRTTGQSLLDYVPYGATTEGFGGTYATQENFRLMRQALDAEGAKLGRYIRLCNYCSGLCMPEIAAMGAFERLDMMLNDALYGILFRDINMKRTMIDQYFSRVINAYAGAVINTGEDNYLTTSDAYEEAHTVLASQFINEQLAKKAGLQEEQMGLGHAFEMSPQLENAFVYELAQAQMAREIFPKAPLKYMPPTKHMTGDIFMGNVQDALFNIVTILTGQKIHLLGMLTEAIHTPFMSDRALAIENASYIFRTMEKFGEEIEFKKDGIMAQRASHVLQRALNILLQIEKEGLFNALEKGVFAGVKRSQDGGKGLSGVFEKSENYFNPFMNFMLDELNGGKL